MSVRAHQGARFRAGTQILRQSAILSLALLAGSAWRPPAHAGLILGENPFAAGGSSFEPAPRLHMNSDRVAESDSDSDNDLLEQAIFGPRANSHPRHGIADDPDSWSSQSGHSTEFLAATTGRTLDDVVAGRSSRGPGIGTRGQGGRANGLQGGAGSGSASSATGGSNGQPGVQSFGTAPGNPGPDQGSGPGNIETDEPGNEAPPALVPNPPDSPIAEQTSTLVPPLDDPPAPPPVEIGALPPPTDPPADPLASVGNQPPPESTDPPPVSDGKNPSSPDPFDVLGNTNPPAGGPVVVLPAATEEEAVSAAIFNNPEPGTLSLLLLGLGAMAATRRWQRAKNRAQPNG